MTHTYTHTYINPTLCVAYYTLNMDINIGINYF